MLIVVLRHGQQISLLRSGRLTRPCMDRLGKYTGLLFPSANGYHLRNQGVWSNVQLSRHENNLTRDIFWVNKLQIQSCPYNVDYRYQLRVSLEWCILNLWWVKVQKQKTLSIKEKRNASNFAVLWICLFLCINHSQYHNNQRIQQKNLQYYNFPGIVEAKINKYISCGFD